MNKKILQEYFSFSRKERNAVMILVLLIIIIFILPYVFPASEDEPIPELIAALEDEKLPQNGKGEQVDKKLDAHFPHFSNSDHVNNREAVLFTFDPNTISADGWMKLGVKARTAETIAKYRSKGGKFRLPSDLRKIYGLPPGLAEQLIPYVNIPKNHNKPAWINKFKKEEYPINNSEVKHVVDVNTADSLAFIALNGIGPTLAGRIVKFRERLGGFYDLRQVSEVYGLPDSNFQKLSSQLIISSMSIKKININLADLPTLSQHPYIGRKLANVILQYRHQHGNFKSVNALADIDIVSPEILKKISPYLIAEE